MLCSVGGRGRGQLSKLKVPEKEGSRKSVLIPEPLSFAFQIWVFLGWASFCLPAGDGMTGTICPCPCERQ